MPGRQWYALAAIGRDRPGIVADLSEFVFACGCNLEDASMTMLGDEFATLMLLSGVGDDLATKLADGVRKLEWERRLTIFLRPLEAEPVRADLAGHEEWRLTARGIDKAGIVANVARRLANRDILIADLRGRIIPMPQSGTPLYVLDLRLLVPPSVEIDDLRRDLAETARQLEVEIDLVRPDAR